MSQEAWTETDAIGGNGGDEFRWVSNQATPINAITVWNDQNAITAIKFQYIDGLDDIVAGKPRGNSSQILFAPGERIKDAFIWETDGTTTGGNVCVSQIVIQTTGTQVVSLGSGGSRSRRVDFGSCFIVGASGRAGEYLDSLSFYCLRPVKSVSIDIQDSQWSRKYGTKEGIEHFQFDRATFSALRHDELKWWYEGGKQVTNSTTLTQDSITRWGVTPTTISGTFPYLDDSTAGVWKAQAETNKAPNVSNTITVGKRVEGTLAANNNIYAWTSCLIGKLDIEYYSTVTLTFQDGSTFDLPEMGQFHTIAYVNGVTETSAPWEYTYDN